jgi:hypothetical protein
LVVRTHGPISSSPDSTPHAFAFPFLASLVGLLEKGINAFGGGALKFPPSIIIPRNSFSSISLLMAFWGSCCLPRVALSLRISSTARWIFWVKSAFCYWWEGDC